MPNTIAQNLARLTAARTAIASAITAKGGTVTSGDGLEEFPADIATIPSGVASVPAKDVNFYDYDGTIVHSYTAEEFAELTELPANPSHTGLTAQGWNWPLANAKTYVSTYGGLNIGQNYVTSDGKTRLYIELEDGRTSPDLQLYLNANSEVDIDWGDGSSHSILTSTSSGFVHQTHAYPAGGGYTIAITVTNGSFEFRSNSSNVSTTFWNKEDNITSLDKFYANSVQKIEIGSGITALGARSFLGFGSLSTITIPNTITSFTSGVFKDCTSLKNINIPNGVSTLQNYTFNNCTSIRNVSISSGLTATWTECFNGCTILPSIYLGNAVLGTNKSFINCYSLANIVLATTTTSIGNSAFENCYSLNSIVVPSAVTSIGTAAFGKCANMSFIQFKGTTPPTVAASSAFADLGVSTLIVVPINCLSAYSTATNYPSSLTYTYLVAGTYNSGETLPTTSTDGYTLTWYATMEDAKNGSHPITEGNGKEVYGIA